jgi:hypothetical protein
MKPHHFILATSFLAAGLAFGAAGPAADLIAKGDAFDTQLKTASALAAYQAADKATPNDAIIQYKLAREYGLSMNDVSSTAEKKKLGEQALAAAKRSVELAPKNATAQLSLAVCYGRLAPLLDNKTKIAYSKLVKSYTEAALALDSSNDLGYYLLGSWNYEMANLNPILRAVAQLVYGQLPPASNDDAVKNFKKSIELNPQRAASHVDLGRAYAAMGKNDLAKDELNKGLAIPNKEKDDPEVKQRARDALKKL